MGRLRVPLKVCQQQVGLSDSSLPLRRTRTLPGEYDGRFAEALDGSPRTLHGRYAPGLGTKEPGFGSNLLATPQRRSGRRMISPALGKSPFSGAVSSS